MYEIMLIAGVLLWLAALAVYLSMPVASIFHPATYYLFFHGLVFALRPVMNYFYGYTLVYRLYEFTPSMHDKVMALVAADVGLVAFMVAVLAVGNVQLRVLPSVGTRPDRQRLTSEALLIAAVICAPIAIVSLRLSVTARFADTNTMLRDAGTGIAYNTTDNGYLTDASLMLLPIVVLIAWQFRFRWWAMIPFLADSSARLLIGSSRWTFVMASASLALLYLYDRRRRWFSWQFVVAAPLVLVLFSTLGSQRDFFRSMFGAVSAGGSSDVYALRPLEGMDFANQEYLEYLTYAVPNRTGTWNYFINNLQIFTEPVPRVLWPGKPIGAPIQLFKLWDYGSPIGMTNSLPGEGWQDLGLVGVVIWCGLFGVVFGAFYRWFARSRQSGFEVAVYAMLLPLSVQFFRDGILVTFMKFPLFILVPIAVWKGVSALGFRRVLLRRARLRPVGTAGE